MDIGKLLAPRSVAVVGASEDRHYSRSIIGNLRLHGFAEESIYPINPRYQEISGLPCYPDLAALPRVPDAVAVLVGRRPVPELLRTATAAGIGAALVIADGYAEESADGLAEQQAIGAIARAGGLALLGPNTLGYVVPSTGAGLWCAGTLPARLNAGGVAILAQSSGMLNLIMNLAGQRLLGVRACVSVGNAEVIGLPELITHFVADPGCAVIGLVVESIDRPRDLMRALLAARAAGKPVVVLKIGVSELGRQNSVAHTGRMAGPEQGWSALFDRLGVTVVRDLDDYLETLTLFGGLVTTLPPGPVGLAVATISGGETSLICDIAAQESVALASLDSGTLTTLRSSIGKDSMIGNPLDLQNTHASRPDVFWSCLEALSRDPHVDVVAVRFNLAPRPTPAQLEMYRRVAQTVQGAGAALVVLSRAYEHLDLEWWRFFAGLSVPFVLSYRNALRAFGALDRWLRRPATVVEPGAVPERATTAAGQSRALGPADTVHWLTAAGVPLVRSALADTPAQAAAAAEELGWPVVLKAVAPGLVHKSEAGGVALNLTDVGAVESSAKAMTASVADTIGVDPDEVHFEVQQMVPTGTEMIIGMTPDPSWGPVVLVGAGGIHAETTGDVVWDLPPIPPDRAEELLRRLRVWPVLAGARGQQAGDVAALTELISSFSTAVGQSSGIAAVDLNPVIVAAAGSGVRAVDAAVLVHEDGAA